MGMHTVVTSDAESSKSAPPGGLSRKAWAQTLITGLAAGLATFGLIAVGKAVLLGHWWKIGTLIFYAMVLVFFIVRRRTTESSRSPRHWIFALTGTFLPFALIPVESEYSSLLFWGTLPLQLLGMSISILALSALGRSFGIVAANRSIKSTGPYAIVRHPLYLGEAIWFLSIVLQNLSWHNKLSWLNVLIFAAQISCQIRRIFDEEALLNRDRMYQQYRNLVQYRLIRRVF
jgi:protein-S-isoprenylcysteine O-methyltransferase Ste14